tara:strand:+ start:682 stop:957 length:276 start_codon:yes stop_codon:yes gene_type:complete
MKYLRLVKATMGLLSTTFYMVRQGISLWRMIEPDHQKTELDDQIDNALKQSNQWMANSGMPVIESAIEAEEQKPVILDDETINQLLKDLEL